MILPIRTDSPLRNTPWMNGVLIALNVGVFAAQQFWPGLAGRYLLRPLDPHLPQFLTYAFLHQNVMHLVSNMLFLYIFGNNVNDKVGGLGYLLLYLGGAVFAGTGYVLCSSGPAAAGVLGASGAVSAVTGAYLVLFPRSHITVVYWILFIGTLEIPSMYVIAFFFAKDVFLNFSGQSHVAHMAHISGSAFGFGVCLLLLMLRLLPRDQFDVLALVQRWNKRRQYRNMVREGYDPFGYAPTDRTPSQPVDPAAEKTQELRSQIQQATASRNLDQAAELYLQLRTLDEKQVLPRQTQLDLANHFAALKHYPQAADAYEKFLATYGGFDQIEQVQLMLALIYARYLNRTEQARELLTKALPRLRNERERELAQAELSHLESLTETTAGEQT